MAEQVPQRLEMRLVGRLSLHRGDLPGWRASKQQNLFRE
jgi:hypothetical protein